MGITADAGALGTGAKVDFLSRAESYAERTRRVDVIETHMAWVFLTDAHAYKMKKPVRHEFLDFSTLEARERDCREEVRLNRRLAERVYLGVTPLTLAPHGLQLGGEGAPVDWLVRMLRLPDELLLDRAIARGEVPRADLERLAELLARLYASLPPEPLAPGEYVERLRRDVAREREGLLATEQLDDERVRRVAAKLLALLDRHAPLLEERARSGRIVEAHGDLRPEHVCLGSDPVVIDCLEFERDFRILDSADELAFFALECEQLGAPEIGRDLAADVARLTGDRVPRALTELHMARRAFLRAKLAIWHLRDPRPIDRWTRKAVKYLASAEAHCAAAHE